MSGPTSPAIDPAAPHAVVPAEGLEEVGSAQQSDQPVVTAAAVAWATVSLVACGGGDTAGTGSSDVSAPALPADFSQARKAPTRRILGRSSAQAADSASLPSASELMDWAERTYGHFFPGHMPNAFAAQYTYRYYAATGNYLAVDGTDVYVLGPPTGGAVLRVGSMADFAPLVLASSRAGSDEAAARFLQQAQVGCRRDELAAVRSMGYAAWLDAQMALPLTERAWDWMVVKGFGNIDERALYDTPGSYTCEYALAWQMAHAPDALRKRVALALSEYFVVSALVAQMSWTGLAMAHYWDQLNEYAFGNFRDLLEAMTLNPAMGAWLNTRGNLKEEAATGRVPDENYAREVMQLFTIGLVRLNRDGSVKMDANGQPMPTFTQDDVSNLARVFTGYDFWDDGRRFIAPVTNNGRPYQEYTRRAMVWDVSKHSTLQVRVLGRTIPAGSNGPARLTAALDILFQHANVGPFFARQMIQRLVSSNPSPGYVQRVAAAFDDNGFGVRGDLKAVWKAILLDDEARSASGLASTTHGKLREPMVRVFQWLRSFNVQSRSGGWAFSPPVGDPLIWYGQRPLASPSVFNYFRPGYVPPGTALAAAGATAPEFQIVNESSVSQWVNYIDILNVLSGVPSLAPPWHDVYTDFAEEAPLAADLPALVNHLNLVLAAGQLSAVTLQRIVGILQLGGAVQPSQTEEVKRLRVVAAVTIVMSCAEYLVQK